VDGLETRVLRLPSRRPDGAFTSTAPMTARTHVAQRLEEFVGWT
jgi:hypothetical protein